MLPLRARVDQGPMAIKGYSEFLQTPALREPYHQIVYCHKQDTRWCWDCRIHRLQRCSRCILQPQPTGQSIVSQFPSIYQYIYIYIYIYICVCVCVCVHIYIIYIYIYCDLSVSLAINLQSKSLSLSLSFFLSLSLSLYIYIYTLV